MIKLYLSPSNQPANRYCVGNTTEKAQMEAVAKKVKEILDAGYDCQTVMATLSMGIGYNERPKEAKDKGCNVYLAIHSNAGGGGKASGAVAFYHPSQSTGKALASAIVKELNAICPVKSNRATSVASGMNAFNGQGYGEIRSPYQRGLTAVLAETDFHDNPATARWIIDSRDAIAAAYVRALVSVLGIAPKSQPQPEPQPEPSGQLYRVRKSWADAASQKGAFRVLDNAKRCADENPGYAVFDEGGRQVYPAASGGSDDGPLYRVRKSWADAASQKGAFRVLDNAKRCADENPGYAVFDEAGKAVYTGKKPAPAYTTYTVKKGDSLWAIAARTLGKGTRYTEIKKLNGLTSDIIYAGQVLKIPQK